MSSNPPRPPTASLPLGDIQDGQRAFERLSGECHCFGHRGMRMDGQSDIRRVRAHFDRKSDLRDQFPGVGADDSPAYDASGFLVEKKLRKAIVPIDGEGTSACRPREHPLAVLDN